MLTPSQAPSTLTKIRVAKQANKSLCHLKLMGFVIPVTILHLFLSLNAEKVKELSSIVREQVA